MYSLFIYLYIAGIKLAALFGHRKAKLMIEGHKNTFPLLKERLCDGVCEIADDIEGKHEGRRLNI